MGHYRTLAAWLLALGLGCSGLARAEVASWYGAFHEGRAMASGCPFRAGALSAASPTLPLGTWLRVRNLANRRAIRVQVTDRGPYVRGRALDLSEAAAKRLGFAGDGTAQVRIQRLGVGPIRCRRR